MPEIENSEEKKNESNRKTFKAFQARNFLK